MAFRAHPRFLLPALFFLAVAAGTVATSALQDEAAPMSPAAPQAEAVPIPPAERQDEAGPAARTEEVNGDLLTAGRAVHVGQTVPGDVAAAGQDVVIDGDVTGYLMSAGRHVTVSGPVGNDVWAAGETVDVMSTVGNNATIAGREVTLHPTATVAGNARLAGATVRTEGMVAHDLQVAGSTVSIGGEVGGTVRASGARVVVEPDTIIRGDFIAESPQAPEVSPQAQILGTVRHEPTRSNGGWASPSWPMFWLWSCLALFVLGAAALLLAPAWPREVAGVLRARPGTSLVTGLIVMILVPAAVVLFAISVVGIPLAIASLGLYVAAVILSVMFVSFRVGDWILSRANRERASRWAALVVGAIVMSLIVSIPVVGAIVSVLAAIWGAGALFLERRSHRTVVAATGA